MNKNTLIITIIIFIVLANGYIGHYYSPLGIDLTPIVIILTSSLVIWGMNNISVVYKSILMYLPIAMNDILIKLYSGGRHDYEGAAWIALSMFLGLIPVFIYLIISIFIKDPRKRKDRINALFIFLFLIIIHFLFLQKQDLVDITRNNLNI